MTLAPLVPQATLDRFFTRVRVEVANADPNEPREQDLRIEGPTGHDAPCTTR